LRGENTSEDLVGRGEEFNHGSHRERGENLKKRRKHQVREEG
jgi:hypothetical protein